MDNFIKIFFIFVSLFISLIFGGNFEHNRSVSFDFTLLRGTAEINKTVSVKDNTFVEANNNCCEIFLCQLKRCGSLSNSLGASGILKISKVLIDKFDTIKFGYKFIRLNPNFAHEICTRAP